MKDIVFRPLPAVTVSRTVLTDFETAFKNLRPSVSTTGNVVKIKQRDKEYQIPLSQARSSQGYLR